MKYAIIIVLCGIILYSCNSSSSKILTPNMEKLFEEKTNITLHALSTLDTTQDYLAYVPLSISSFVLKYLDNNDSISIIYPLDGNCSLCITEFADLLMNIKIIESKIPIYALLTGKDSSTVVYHLNNMKIPHNVIHIHESALLEEEFIAIKKMPLIAYKRKIINCLWHNY